ncbi:MAG: hypothetical protein QM680_03575 [Luteolibacter sp.]
MPVPAPACEPPAAIPLPSQEIPLPQPVEKNHQPTPGYRPEPRQLPTRSSSFDHVNKQIPDTRDPAVINAPAVYAHQDHKMKLRRILIPALFISLTLATILGILIYLNNTQKPSGTPPAIKSTQAKPQVPVEPKTVTPPAKHAAPAKTATPSETSAPGVTALKTLETFLAAKTLEERLPLIESRTPQQELASSIIAKPLPAANRIDTDYQETNSIEKVTDIFYNVDFLEADGKINPQTILVRTRGTATPKVVVDPLLDLYGGRLKKYASAPSDKPENFEVIVSAGAFCYDENVPNRDKKLTLKLLARDNTKEIARAFFGKRSRIGEMLESDFSGLSYGQAKACTVTLRWNKEEDRNKPYLEAINMKSLNWNP